MNDFNPVIGIMGNDSTSKSCTAQASQLLVLATCFCHPCTVPHVKSFHVMSCRISGRVWLPFPLCSFRRPIRSDCLDIILVVSICDPHQLRVT